MKIADIDKDQVRQDGKIASLEGDLESVKRENRITSTVAAMVGAIVGVISGRFNV